jgi:twinkle protein
VVLRLIEVFEYARARYGCDQFIIDSLMRLGVASDDYNGQETAIYRLVDWSVSSCVHVHLVAHAKKGERDRGVPETQDVKGAMEIGANAFNIISIWRNRKLEDAIQAAKKEEATPPEALAKLHERSGVLLNVAKQRNGDFEGKVGLWFDQETYQYQDGPLNPNRRRKYTALSDTMRAAE